MTCSNEKTNNVELFSIFSTERIRNVSELVPIREEFSVSENSHLPLASRDSSGNIINRYLCNYPNMYLHKKTWTNIFTGILNRRRK